MVRHVFSEVQWGFRTPTGQVYPSSERTANEGYLTAEEYARKRAEVTGGVVLTRRRIVEITDWEEAP